MTTSTAIKLRVWDLPTRLFHWALALLVVVSFVTVKVGGNWMTWHFYAGYAILALILFRIAWGFVGGRYARFASFAAGPGRIIAYLRAPAGAAVPPGHSPLGSLSVFALLAAIGIQAALGLFANDEIVNEGPLVDLVSRDTSDTLTTLHRLNERVIMVLVVLHLAAIAFYSFVRRRPLVAAMIHGDAPAPARDEAVVDAGPASGEEPPATGPLPSRDDAALRARAALVLALCAALVWWIVR